MPELKCPECGTDNVTMDDCSVVDGSPREGWLILNAYCGDNPGEGHCFQVRYTMRFLEVVNKESE